MVVHIFNPETDYALASFSPYYTPPAEIIALRRDMALAPLGWASEGDAILLLDEPAQDPGMSAPGIDILTLDDISGYLSAHPDAVIAPWGWNPMLRQRLLSAGVPESYLPSDCRLEMIRRLSHRFTSVEFNTILNIRLSANGLDTRHCSPLPELFSDAESLAEWEKQHHPAFLKAPWSSSGRGIMFTDGLDTTRHILPWASGIIRRQGGVIAETAADKTLDFATEWRISEISGTPEAEFLGVSVFEASKRGKYHANTDAVQSRLMRIIKCCAPDFGEDFIRSQKEALEQLIASHCCDGESSGCYSGYVGIDMLAEPDGTIRGGIELNFRRTMGIPGPEVCIIGGGNVGSHLFRAFTQAHIDCTAVSGRSRVFPRASVYIVCVSDSQVEHVCSRIRPPEGAIVAHTSGSVGMEAVKRALGEHDGGYGVFYPLQTVTKDVPMDYSSIPFLIEGSDPETLRALKKLATVISSNVAEADSEVRARYHVAAVLTCNFTNHLCTLADEYLRSEGLDFRMLLPLMGQTVEKLHDGNPARLQTGPAARGDMEVINSHLRRLGEESHTARIYRILTESIIRHISQSSENEQISN